MLKFLVAYTGCTAFGYLTQLWQVITAPVDWI